MRSTNSAHRHTASTAHPLRASALLTARVVRRVTLGAALGAAAFLAFEAMAYNKTYADPASRGALTIWARNPSVRILIGPGAGVETLGGFAVWDAGLYVTLGLGAWALTTAAKVLRGAEAEGQTDLLLAGPVSAVRLLAAQLAVLYSACAVIGLAVFTALAGSRAQLEGSAVYAVMVALYCASLVALSAVTSQLFRRRRAAAGTASGIFALLFVLRMVGNSTDDRAWMRWLSPAGWLDNAAAFGANRWELALAPIGAVLALTSGALLLRTRRDTGSGMLPERDHYRTRRFGMRGPAQFAWRMNQSVLLAWVAGLTLTGAVIGGLMPTMNDVLTKDEGYRKLMLLAGFDLAHLSQSYIAMMSKVIGLVVTLYTAFRIGAARQEESSGYVDSLLVRPLQRWRWLAGHVASVTLSVLVLTAVAAVSLWGSARLAGEALPSADAFTGMLNMLPATAIFAGAGVLAFGLAPRLTVAVPLVAVVITFIIGLIGPVLLWPERVLALSPYHHLANAPVESVRWNAAMLMTATGLALTAAGHVAFERRDIKGA